MDTLNIAHIRAGAHAEPAESLAERPEAAWRPGVTDEGIARLMYALEDGAEPWRDGQLNWRLPAKYKISPRYANAWISEAIRTGLVTHYLSAHLVPALVHLAADGRSACHVAGEGMGPKRVRLVEDPIIVDCLACLDTL